MLTPCRLFDFWELSLVAFRLEEPSTGQNSKSTFSGATGVVSSSSSSFSPRVGHRWLAWDDTTGVLLFRDGANSTAAHSRQAHRRETREHTSKTAGRAEE